MAEYRKKAVVIDAITWDELVAHGIKTCGGNVVNGMPWSFEYKGHPITHENDGCYLIPTLEGTHHMTPGDMLITGVKGEIYPCKSDIFYMTYDPVDAAQPPVGLPTKLLIATPFYSVTAFSPYITSLVHTCKMLSAAGIEFDFWELSGDSYVDRARNTIANKFMDSDYSHLIFIDSDHKWDLDGFVNLLKADADVVGAGYPCKNKWDFFSCILEDSPDHRPVVNEQGLIKAWGVPTGFMKIRREVFVKLAEKMPENYYMTGDPDTGEQSKVFNFFGRIPPMGEDISFCRRWASIGGELWVEPRVTITHFGIKGWEGNYHEFLMACPGGSKAPAEEEEGSE